MSDVNRGRILVGFQFLLLFALVLIPHGNLWFVSEEIGTVSVLFVMTGLSVALFGIVSLGSSLTATPVPKRSAVLRTTGMYAIVRHPIYSGLLLIGFGLTFPSGSVVTVVVYLLFVALISYKARFEEALLLKKFPEYRAYAAKVGRIFPFVGRIRSQSQYTPGGI